MPIAVTLSIVGQKLASKETRAKMSAELLLGVDIGTSAIKASAIDHSGRSVAIGTAPTPFVSTGDEIEMTADSLLFAVHSAISQIVDFLPRVAAVGIASMGESGTTITDEGPSRLPILAWHDSRGTETVATLTREFGDDIRRRTGREARNVTTVAKLGWLAGRGADLSGTWTGVAGLTLWKLTGALGQEHSLAATSGAFDPRLRAWDRDILAVAGLGSIDWAPVARGGSVFGTISAEGAAWSGLRAGIPVTLSGHDHPVGVVGAGGDPGGITDSMGTGEPLVMAWSSASDASDHPVIPGIPGHLTLTSWPGTDRLMLLWETLRPGIGLGNLSNLLGIPRDDVERDALGVLDDSALSSTDLEELQSGRLPRSLEGVAPAEAFASAIEGYALAIQGAEKAMRLLGGVDGRTLLIGGGLRSERWVLAKGRRSVFPLDAAVEREAVSRGAALLAGVAAGWWAVEEYPSAPVIPVAPGTASTALYGSVVGHD